MNKIESLFIDIVRKSINSEKPEEVSLSSEEIQKLLILSRRQNLLPMVYDYLSNTKALVRLDKETRSVWKKRAFGLVVRQITQTNEFLNLIADCQEIGYDPVVVKGIICRSLYPVSLVRVSVDEDMFINRRDVDFYNHFFLSQGLHPDKENAEFDKDYEFSYHKENSPTYIELHCELFDPAAEGYHDLNRFFDKSIFDRTVKVLIDDINVRTLSYTDHLLFIILHAYKHFIYSGVGIRPICDIGMFADRYSDQIDWQYIRKCLEEVNVFYYVKALFNVIRIHLLPDSRLFKHIIDWNVDEIDISNLMDDILDSGALGDSSLDRLHTSNMTLHAVEGHRGNYVLSSLFPSIRKIKGSYTYLDKYPFLLPVAWTQRIIRYLKDTIKKKDSSASSSVRLGMERIELLKKYRIIS